MGLSSKEIIRYIVETVFLAFQSSENEVEELSTDHQKYRL